MIKSLLSVVMICIAGNVYAAERVIEFPQTPDGIKECNALGKDLGGEFRHSSARIVGFNFLYKVKGSDKYYEVACGTESSLKMALNFNAIDPIRYPLVPIYIAIYDPKEFPQMLKNYNERQQAIQADAELQRKARLQQYGL